MIITRAGIIKILNIADPTTVPKAADIPLVDSCNIKKNKKEVKNSGNEEPIALIVAPVTPSGNL